MIQTIFDRGKDDKRMEKVIDTKQIKTISKTKQIAVDAMFVALTLVFTAVVNIQLGGDGTLIHLGNIPLFLAAMIYGKRTGTLAGAIGMGMFDLLSGYAVWAPCTIITCGLMGFVVGAICHNRKSFFLKFTAIFAALLIKIVGYYIYEAYVLGSGNIVALKSVPANITQVVVAGVVVLIIETPIERGLRFFEK